MSNPRTTPKKCSLGISIARQAKAHDRIMKRYRDAQAKKVMPLIGPLLDAWDGLSNDMVCTIDEESSSLTNIIAKIQDGMEKP